MSKEQREFVWELLEDYREAEQNSRLSYIVEPGEWEEFDADIAARRAEFDRLFPKESE